MKHKIATPQVAYIFNIFDKIVGGKNRPPTFNYNL